MLQVSPWVLSFPKLWLGMGRLMLKDFKDVVLGLQPATRASSLNDSHLAAEHVPVRYLSPGRGLLGAS